MDLLSNPVFGGITEEEYSDMCACGCVRTAEYSGGSYLFRCGDKTREFGVLLSGKIHIESTDLWGNRVILHDLSAGQAFSETYAFCGAPMMVDVAAVGDCKVLYINLGAMLGEGRSRGWYEKMLYNLLALSSAKNLAWSGRMLCITAKGIRARVMTYLSSEAVKRGSRSFALPFDRQQMADYLNVERSALSKELGRMKREGILDFDRNYFRLYTLDG